MIYEGIKTEYLCYLMNRVGLEAEGPDGYLRLCETLQNTEFVPQTAMDENRCRECMDLRRDFVMFDHKAETPEIQQEILDILDGIFGENGTMIELLTVLAEKMGFELCDSEFEASTRKWFTEMLVNCGVYDYATNECFEREGTEEIVLDAMNTVIFNKIGWDGEGGLFPLVYPKYDQRKVELVIQMNNYLEENYDV